jgi:hypothetical protein
MPLDFTGYRANDESWSRFSAMPAQQQVGRAGTTVARLGGCCREDMAPQRGLLQPARKQALEDPRPARAKSPSGNDQDASATRITRYPEEGGELSMRLSLGHSVQIKACLDTVQTAF